MSLHHDSKGKILHLHINANRIDIEGNTNNEYMIGKVCGYSVKKENSTYKSSELGHSGRRRSCSILSMTMIAKGKTVMLSSNPPTRSVIIIDSLEVRKNIGIYYKWHKAAAAK